jgi:hypothetical protein
MERPLHITYAKPRKFRPNRFNKSGSKKINKKEETITYT